MTLTRSATASYKGYTFQRARALNLILTKYCKNGIDHESLNRIYFQEENHEDIDFFEKRDGNGTVLTLYQEKYRENNTNESLTIDSGLSKVIVSHFDKNASELREINYEVFSVSGKINKSKSILYFEKLLHDNTYNTLIGRFFIINYLAEKKLDYSKSYHDNIKVIEEYDVDKLIKKPFQGSIQITEFCKYCYDDRNINSLIEYLKKLKICISNNDFSKIHNETISKLKELLPEFNSMYNKMSTEYTESFSYILYGLFESNLINNLFDKNEEKSIRQLIDEIKKTINATIDLNSSDIVTLLSHTISHFHNRENGEDLKDLENNLISNEIITDYILKNKITCKKFLLNMINTGRSNPADNRWNCYIGIIMRKLLYQICRKLNYNSMEDKKLTGFISRSHNKKQNYVGKNQSSLNELDKYIKKQEIQRQYST